MCIFFLNVSTGNNGTLTTTLDTLGRVSAEANAMTRKIVDITNA
ncbi:unnamed protein product [marine sediment metagenome]|uniref:Uncharacterized protein n=1 Tax=marine sediment metagenome TaxID=412755 RepID=X1G6D8_9ZZZZ